jgi:hypothetical protein
VLEFITKHGAQSSLREFKGNRLILGGRVNNNEASCRFSGSFSFGPGTVGGHGPAAYRHGFEPQTCARRGRSATATVTAATSTSVEPPEVTATTVRTEATAEPGRLMAIGRKFRTVQAQRLPPPSLGQARRQLASKRTVPPPIPQHGGP